MREFIEENGPRVCRIATSHVSLPASRWTPRPCGARRSALDRRTKARGIRLPLHCDETPASSLCERSPRSAPVGIRDRRTMTHCTETHPTESSQGAAHRARSRCSPDVRARRAASTKDRIPNLQNGRGTLEKLAESACAVASSTAQPRDVGVGIPSKRRWRSRTERFVGTERSALDGGDARNRTRGDKSGRCASRRSCPSGHFGSRWGVLWSD